MKNRYAQIFVILFWLVAVAMLLIAGGIYKIKQPSSDKQSNFSPYITAENQITEEINIADAIDSDLDLPDEDIAWPSSSGNFAPNKKDLRFSLNLLQKGVSDAGSNIIISPASFYIIAVLLANGAEGESLAELKKMLLLPNDADMQQVNQDVEAYLHGVSSKIEINSSLWADKLTSKYKKAVKSLAEIKSRPRYTSKINNWIADKTSGRITDLVDNRKAVAGDIFVVNTVYFKDKWEKTFNETDTNILPFYSLDSTEPDRVYMMHQSDDNILYYEDDKMQSIKLLYRDGDYLRIFLPRKEIDFTTFLQNLQISDLDVKYTPQYVLLSIPRFEIDRTFDTMEMTELLNRLGVINLFKRYNIDFEKLGRGEKYLAELLHRANIKVDEEGTEASAATFAYMALDESVDIYNTPPKIFKADHPFVFMINDGLFIGVYVKGDMQ